MMSEKDMQLRIKEIESDARFRAKPATVDINAPLALIQLSLEVERDVLRQVLAG